MPRPVGKLWQDINDRQAVVHSALMAEDDEPLRAIFADPIRTDLFYGVDNLCWSVHGKDLATINRCHVPQRRSVAICWSRPSQEMWNTR